MKTVSRKEVSNIRMVAGNENTISHIIHDNILKEWVGLGWIELRKATKKDKEMYPTITE